MPFEHAPSPPARLAVLIPVYNDWSCLGPLLRDFDQSRLIPKDRTVYIVDDGSTESIAVSELSSLVGQHSVQLVRLGTNLGHQRAIAAGLVAVASEKSFDAVIVMDADGEDRPVDCDSLWRAHVGNPEAIVVAQRAGRTESFRFKISYRAYRGIFRALTGRRLDFGNFSLLPHQAVQRLVLMPELWNHYPASVMKSGQDLNRVPLRRGKRYAGRSRMNFIALINHGMAGIAAFADAVFARLLTWSFAALGLLGLTVAGGVLYRLIVGVPLPGWFALGATAALIAVFQLIAALIVVSFLSLSLRAHPLPPPTQVAPMYLAERRTIRE